MKKIIGYQIESLDGKHNIPDEFFSFQILSNKVATKWLNENTGNWVKVPIHEGEIEDPSFINQ
jgi:hypothetical protein